MAGPRGSSDQRIVAEPDEDGLYPETAPLRRLRLLVTALTIVLMVGVLTVSVLLVIRLGGGGRELAVPEMPETIRLPEGATVAAVGRGAAGEILVLVEEAGGALRLRSYDAATGALLGETAVARD